MVPNYLAQFSGYLVQLQTVENNALSTPSSDIPSTTASEEIPSTLTQ